jgi:hypothetical protein
MAPTTVFLAFAEQDRLFRNLFITQWSRAGAQVRFVEASGIPGCSPRWHHQVQDRIARCEAVIALIGGSTLGSESQLWQIRCAVGEGKPLLGLWVDPDQRVKPVEMGTARCEAWTWENVGDFLDALPPAITAGAAGGTLLQGAL